MLSIGFVFASADVTPPSPPPAALPVEPPAAPPDVELLAAVFLSVLLFEQATAKTERASSGRMRFIVRLPKFEMVVRDGSVAVVSSAQADGVPSSRCAASPAFLGNSAYFRCGEDEQGSSCHRPLGARPDRLTQMWSAPQLLRAGVSGRRRVHVPVPAYDTRMPGTSSATKSPSVSASGPPVAYVPPLARAVRIRRPASRPGSRSRRCCRRRWRSGRRGARAGRQVRR